MNVKKKLIIYISIFLSAMIGCFILLLNTKMNEVYGEYQYKSSVYQGFKMSSVSEEYLEEQLSNWTVEIRRDMFVICFNNDTFAIDPPMITKEEMSDEEKQAINDVAGDIINVHNEDVEQYIITDKNSKMLFYKVIVVNNKNYLVFTRGTKDYEILDIYEIEKK